MSKQEEIRNRKIVSIEYLWRGFVRQVRQEIRGIH